MANTNWQWKGDKQLRYMLDDVCKCILRKDRIGPPPDKAFGWFLFDGDGERVLGGLNKDRQVWRTTKQAALEVAGKWLAGEEVQP